MGSCASKKTTVVTPTKSATTFVTTGTYGERSVPLSIDGQLGAFVMNDSTSYPDILRYYTLKSDIGRGQFGSVKLALNKARRKFAVKIIPKEKVKQSFHMLKRELQYLKVTDHPNIVRLYDVFEDKRNVNIVMDYLAGGDLYDLLEKKNHLPELDAGIIMFKLFHSVSHMHFLGICHRDLKPENFMFDTKREHSEIKIIDFGLGNKFDEVNNEMHTVVGTPYYVAPEVLRRSYGKECDIWSLGVITYALLVGFPPFNGDSDQEIQRKVLKGDFSFKHAEWETVSKEAKDLIKVLLNTDPQKRLSAAEALNHPWFQSITPSLYKPIDPVILRRIKAFRAGNALRKEALKVMCQFVPNEETRMLNSAFRTMDVNHTGFISQEGMAQGIGPEPSEPFSLDDIRALFAQADLYRGLLSYTEYVVAALNPEAYLTPEPLEAGFKYFDAAEKGFITLEDARKVFNRSGKIMQDTDITRLLNDYDLNRDGNLDFEEFSAMVRQGTKPGLR